MNVKWLGSLALCIAFDSAWAQTNVTTQSAKEVEIKEIVFSATRFEEEAWKSGSSISVIPESDFLLQRPIQTSEFLRGEPGVTVNTSTGAPGGLSQVSIRGLPFSRTLFVVDGLRLNRPIDSIANFSDVAPLLLGNVELLRGMQSSLYGSEAEGGVVSIQAPRGKGKPSVGTSFEAGTFDSRRERVFSQGKIKDFDWNTEYMRFDTDNERPNHNFRQNAAAMRLGYDVSEIVRVDLVSRWNDFTVGTPSGILGFGANDPDDRLIRRMLMVSPSFNVTPFEEWESALNLGFIGVGQRFESKPIAPFGGNFVNHSESLQLNWQNTIRLADWNTLVAGVEARNEHTTTEADSGSNVFNRAVQSVYFSDSIRWEDRWGMTLSTRFDDNERFRDAWTYRVSQYFTSPVDYNRLLEGLVDLPIRVNYSRLHMSYGTAFRAPSISELQPLFGPNSGNNPNLIPETSEGYDIGFTQPFLDGQLEADATYFYNNVVNLIGTDATFTFQNISEARTEGLENSLTWEPSKNFSLRAAFTLTSTTSKDPRFPGRNLPRIPRETASLNLTGRPLDPLELGIKWSYTGSSFDNATNTRELRDFHRVDLFTQYHVTPWLKLFGRGENLLGYRYQQAAGFPALGRTFYGGFEVTF